MPALSYLGHVHPFEHTNELTKDDVFSVGTEPRAGVVRMRIGLTEVEQSIGVLNVSIYTKITAPI